MCKVEVIPRVTLIKCKSALEKLRKRAFEDFRFTMFGHVAFSASMKSTVTFAGGWFPGAYTKGEALKRDEIKTPAPRT